jgi:hypothetical protein
VNDGADEGVDVGAYVGTGIGAGVGANVGANVGAGVGVYAHVLARHMPPVKQSPATRQAWVIAHGGQFNPPQSTSVSSSSCIELVQ